MKKIALILISVLILTGCQDSEKVSEEIQNKIFDVYCDSLRLVGLHKISSSSDYYKGIAERQGNGSDVVSQNVVASNLLWEYVNSGQRTTINELRQYDGEDFRETISQLIEANDWIIEGFEKLKDIRTFDEFKEVMGNYSTSAYLMGWLPRTFIRETDEKSVKIFGAWSLLSMSKEIDMCNNKISVEYWDWDNK